MKPHPHTPRNVNRLHAVEQATAGFNQRLAIAITKAVGTMPCAYLFLLLAILGFPGLHTTIQAYIQWFSQTCLQLVFLPVLSVGQAVLSRHAELMAEEQFNTTTKICSDVEQIMAHLQEETTNGSKETKVRDDGQAQERSNSTIRRRCEDEERATSEANEVNISLTSYLAQMPDHPLAREIERWIASLGKSLGDVSWWKICAGQLALHTWKAYVSVKFIGSSSTHGDVFVYSDIEYLKGMDNGG